MNPTLKYPKTILAITLLGAIFASGCNRSTDTDTASPATGSTSGSTATSPSGSTATSPSGSTDSTAGTSGTTGGTSGSGVPGTSVMPGSDTSSSTSGAGTTGSTPSTGTSGTSGTMSPDTSGSGASGTGTSGSGASTSTSGATTSGDTGSTKGTVGTAMDDSVLTTKVKAALLADSDVKGLDISVETNKGEVMLSGFVNNQTQIDRALKIAQGISGVKKVANKLAIKK